MIRGLVGNRYQVLDKVGEGGAAEVFRAMDTRLERVVVLKVLRESYALDAAFTQRFENEARAAARLNHPAIVEVYDYHREDGRYIIAMEYVPGRSLKQYLAEHAPLPEEESRRIASRVLEALAAAHEAGIIHRDVKPQNVLIAPDGQVKITDFGIAKVLEDASVTQGAPQLGTPHYLSPEQAFGEQVTPRTDLYGVGVMLYEMLSGRLPFEDGSALKIAYAHLFDPPPPLRQVAPRVPEAIARVVERALAKDPAERWASAAEMRAALAAVPARDEPAAPARAPAAPARIGRQAPVRQPPRRAVGWSSALVVGIPLALVLAGFVALALRGSLSDGDRSAGPAGDAPARRDSPAVAATKGEPGRAPTAAGPAPRSTATGRTDPAIGRRAEAPTAGAREPDPAPSLGPAPPEATADRRRERRLVFEDEDFEGGVPVEDSLGRGTTVKRIFGQESGFARVRVRFEIAGTPVGDDRGLASLGLTGTDSRTVEPGDPAPRVRISVNGRMVTAGASPFRVGASDGGSGGWRIAAIPFSASILRSGENVVTIENVSPDGETNAPPWLMLMRAAVVYYEV